MIQEFGALMKTQANVDVEKIMSVSTSSFLSWDRILNETFDYAGNEILSLNKKKKKKNLSHNPEGQQKKCWCVKVLPCHSSSVHLWGCIHGGTFLQNTPEMKYLWLHL